MSDRCPSISPFVGAPQDAPSHRCKKASGHKGRHRCDCIKMKGLRCDVSWKTGTGMISQVRMNAEKDEAYRPYCMRCPGLVRMVKIAPFFWRCKCGAEHDEQRARTR